MQDAQRVQEQHMMLSMKQVKDGTTAQHQPLRRKESLRCACYGLRQGYVQQA